MGHVDHGKTSLLDAIRQTNVVAGEAGGITQHIGAYQVTTPLGDKVTFIDTPGHEAFTAMRARGAKVTDIVVLVVAADDGVMPQTIEAINHAKAAGVPIIVAINKIDKPQADPNRVRTELLQHEIVVESMSGETLEVPVSALKRTNLDKLLEAIHLQAEILDLKASRSRSAEGIVVEAKLERGRGPVGTVLVQRGTLRVGDIVVAGKAWGRVRALIDELGANVAEAGPSIPVEILGFDSAPEAGDQFAVVESEGRAREITDYRVRKRRDTMGSAGTPRTLEQMMQSLKETGRKDFTLLVKGDVQGSVEAIAGSLRKLGTDEVAAQIVHSGVGGITESDVALANASKAVVVGFNVRANAQAKALADRDGVEIRYYNIIYDLVDDVKAAMSGLLAPTIREIYLGKAEILEVFNISKTGKVAGCRVTEGKVERGAKVRLHPRRRRHPRGHAVDLEALQGRGARGPGRPGVRHGVRQLPGHPRRRRHRVLQRRDGDALAVSDSLPSSCGVGPSRSDTLFRRRPRSNPAADSKRTNISSDQIQKIAHSAPPSQRQLRIGELVRHKLAEMLARGEIHDDVIASHVITVPEVRLSPDLKLATRLRGHAGRRRHGRGDRGAQSQQEATSAREVAQAVNLKFAPDIRFRRDETFEEASRIDQLLASAKVRQDVEKRIDGTPQEGQSGPRLGRARQAARHDVDAGGRRRAAAVRGAEGRPRRHARSAGDGHPADRAGRSDEDRAVRRRRREGLPLHRALRRRDRYGRRRGAGRAHVRAASVG